MRGLRGSDRWRGEPRPRRRAGSADRRPARAADRVRRHPAASTSGRATGASSTRPTRACAATDSRSARSLATRIRRTERRATYEREDRRDADPGRRNPRPSLTLEIYVPIRGATRRRSVRRLRGLPGRAADRGARRRRPERDVFLVALVAASSLLALLSGSRSPARRACSRRQNRLLRRAGGHRAGCSPTTCAAARSASGRSSGTRPTAS